jgi:hypothetical protein
VYQVIWQSVTFQYSRGSVLLYVANLLMFRTV